MPTIIFKMKTLTFIFLLVLAKVFVFGQNITTIAPNEPDIVNVTLNLTNNTDNSVQFSIGDLQLIAIGTGTITKTGSFVITRSSYEGTVLLFSSINFDESGQITWKSGVVDSLEVGVTTYKYTYSGLVDGSNIIVSVLLQGPTSTGGGGGCGTTASGGGGESELPITTDSIGIKPPKG